MIFNLSTLISKTKSYKLPLNIFSLDGDGYHPKIEIQVNSVRIKAILDTGASKTAFDHALLREIIGPEVFHQEEKLSTGLGTNSMQCFRATINLQLGDLMIENFDTAVLDLSHI